MQRFANARASTTAGDELLGKNLNSSQTPTRRISRVAASCIAARLAARTHLCKLKGAETRKLETKLL
jgi:hypothetical protein